MCQGVLDSVRMVAVTTRSNSNANAMPATPLHPPGSHAWRVTPVTPASTAIGALTITWQASASSWQTPIVFPPSAVSAAPSWQAHASPIEWPQNNASAAPSWQTATSSLRESQGQTPAPPTTSSSTAAVAQEVGNLRHKWNEASTEIKAVRMTCEGLNAKIPAVQTEAGAARMLTHNLQT